MAARVLPGRGHSFGCIGQHDQGTYLEHIRAALERIAEYTTQGKDAFLASTLLQDAVLRNLEVVGGRVRTVTRPSKAAP